MKKSKREKILQPILHGQRLHMYWNNKKSESLFMLVVKVSNWRLVSFEDNWIPLKKNPISHMFLESNYNHFHSTSICWSSNTEGNNYNYTMVGVKLAFWLVKTSFRLKYRRTNDVTNQEKQCSEQTDFICVCVSTLITHVLIGSYHVLMSSVCYQRTHALTYGIYLINCNPSNSLRVYNQEIKNINKKTISPVVTTIQTIHPDFR